MNSEARQIQVSKDNIHSFIETGLKAMSLINDGDIVFAIDDNILAYGIHIKKEV